jgi:hypothetical protein
VLGSVAVLVSLCVVACGADAERACTLIGAAVGVAVEVRHPGVTGAAVEVCWGGSCVTPSLVLEPGSRAAGTTCAGTAPDDSCSARVEPTGERHGFAVVPDLPAAPVSVRLTLSDQSGSPLVEREIAVTPEMAYPNGPNCPAGGPQARISVGADGSVTEQ